MERPKEIPSNQQSATENGAASKDSTQASLLRTRPKLCWTRNLRKKRKHCNWKTFITLEMWLLWLLIYLSQDGLVLLVQILNTNRVMSTVSGSLSRIHAAFFTWVSLIWWAHCNSRFHLGILLVCMSSSTSFYSFVSSCWHHCITFLRPPQVDNVGELMIFVRRKFLEWPEIFIISIDLHSFVQFVKFFSMPTSSSSFPFKYT